MLTREQLDHLCALTALALSDEQKEILLPQISSILGVIGQLDACVLDKNLEEAVGSISSSSRDFSIELPQEQSGRDVLLSNIHHTITNSMPELKTGLHH